MSVSCGKQRIGWRIPNNQTYYGYMVPPEQESQQSRHHLSRNSPEINISAPRSLLNVILRIEETRGACGEHSPTTSHGVHDGLKGSIMEMLSDSDSHYSQTASVEDQFRDLIVKAMLDQQFISVVVIIDALDECFTDDNEHWRALLRTVAACADLLPTFSLVVTSRDIAEIRSALAKVSYSLRLSTGNEASVEDKSDTQIFFRAKFKDVHSDVPDEKAIQQLTEYAAGSFIWAKMFVGIGEAPARSPPPQRHIRRQRSCQCREY